MNEPRCYTLAQVLDHLQMVERTFHYRRKAGQLPFVEEILPRMGRSPRFKAEPIDRYVAGNWPARQSA